MEAILIFALEISLFVGAFLLINRNRVKPAPVRVRVDSRKKN